MNPSQFHVLLYSFSQGAFHVETLDQTVQSGLSAYANKRTFQDFIVLFVSESRNEIDVVHKQLIETHGRYEPTKQIKEGT